MQNATLSSSFFEESRIKALSLQKEGETALLLWLRLFFTAVREFIDKIVVHERSEPWKKKNYTQQVDVYFNFVCKV